MAVEGSEGCRAVEELQARLRQNVESMQILNCQVNSLQRENMGVKECLEKERAARQTLQLQLESKNQFIQSFTQSSSSSGSSESHRRASRASSSTSAAPSATKSCQPE